MKVEVRVYGYGVFDIPDDLAQEYTATQDKDVIDSYVMDGERLGAILDTLETEIDIIEEA